MRDAQLVASLVGAATNRDGSPNQRQSMNNRASASKDSQGQKAMPLNPPAAVGTPRRTVDGGSQMVCPGAGSVMEMREFCEGVVTRRVPGSER